ncbi:MAG: hypothetical protein R6X13_10925 [bacterium]
MRLALVLLCALAAGAPAMDVLFVGNSHTYVNDLPVLFRGLSEAGGWPVNVEMSAPGGYSLKQHSIYQPTIGLINGTAWDYVVLQEQSQIPAINWCRDSLMHPAARSLEALIAARGAQTAFYLTWGWRDGGVQTYGGHSSPDFRDYFEMQDSVTVSYRMIADELAAVLVPVGEAWRNARLLNPGIDLWQDDECHATLKGTYLGACVFYAVLHGEDPTGLAFHGGLSPADARWLQEVAWQTVSGIAERPVEAVGGAGLVVPSPLRPGMSLRCRQTIRLFAPDGRLAAELRPRDGRVTWDGRDCRGRPVPAGVYLCVGGGVARPVVLAPGSRGAGR